MPAIKKRNGFTLIELSLAIAFLSMLLLIIIDTTNGITSSYRKGLSIKKINAVGRDLIDEFTETVNNSAAIDPNIVCAEYYGKNNDNFDHCIEDEAYKFTYQQHVYDSIVSYGETIEKAPAFGMFCTGTYSYIWNTGYTFDNDTFLSNGGNTIPRVSLSYYPNQEAIGDKNAPNPPSRLNVFRLLKIYDVPRLVCANQLLGGYPEGDSLVITDTDIADISDGEGNRIGGEISIDITKNRLGSLVGLGGNAPEELITSSEIGGLALYEFVVYPPSSDMYSGNRFYVGSFVLGTLNSGATINPSGNSCAAPPGQTYDTDYCALNKFNFAIRATGGN